MAEESARAVGVPPEVLAAYGWAGATCESVPSLINRTFRLQPGTGQGAVLQRLHAIFAPEVNLDIEAVTRRLQERGVPTPRLLRTVDDRPWTEHQGAFWRALSLEPGVTHHTLTSPVQAHSAGLAVGRFHRALFDFDYAFKAARSGVHDTAAHLEGLQAALATPAAVADPEVQQLGCEILDAAHVLSRHGELSSLPLRICHGDLKISNLLFEAGDEGRALCLIDLDTVAPQQLAYELGDALRSWCNSRPEDAPQPNFDEAIFEAGLRGYAVGSKGLASAAEWASIVAGVQTVALELSSRFARDAIELSRFGWDPDRYPSRRAHNLARARSQLALSRLIAGRAQALGDLAERVRQGV
ncbi:MAG: aminoglycoside phosphotransferase family protein [Myxococcales bacterium]|nr:aminoglycoside phosphotransferase family protein [Myxococcales bacterium]